MDTFVLFLFAILVVVYLSNKKDWAAPSVLFTSSFVVSGIIFSLNSLIWNYEISSETEFLIVSGILTFFLGCMFGNLIRLKNVKFNHHVSYIVPKQKMFLLYGISLLLPLLRIGDIISVIGSFNIYGGLGAYRAFKGTTMLGMLIKIVGPICNALCIIMIFIIVSNYLSGVRNKKSYFVPILSYFVASSLSSSRIDVIYMFLYFIITYVFLYRIKTNETLKLKQYRYVIISLLFLAITFFGLGFMTGKSQKQESAVDNISMYAASSFAALDYYVDGFHYNSDNFGKETFLGLTNLFSWIGIDKKYVEERNQEFLNLGDMSHSTNVYTCLKPLIHDFNYTGMYLILFIEGFIFQLFYRRTIVSCKKGKIWWSVFYIYLSAYLMLSSVAERIFSCLLTLTTIMFLLSITPLDRMFIASNKNNKAN